MFYRYGWRGGFLILGALSFNMVVAGAIMKPLNRQDRCQQGGCCFGVLKKQINSKSHIKMNATCQHRECARGNSNKLRYEGNLEYREVTTNDTTEDVNMMKTCGKLQHHNSKMESNMSDRYDNNYVRITEEAGTNMTECARSTTVQDCSVTIEGTEQYVRAESDNDRILGGIHCVNSQSQRDLNCQSEYNDEQSQNVTSEDIQIQNNDSNFSKNPILQNKSLVRKTYDQTDCSTETSDSVTKIRVDDSSLKSQPYATSMSMKQDKENKDIDNTQLHCEKHRHTELKTDPVGVSPIQTDDKLTNNSKAKYYKVTTLMGIQMLCQNKPLLVYLLGFLLWGIVYSGWTLFLVSYAISKGMTPKEAVILSSLGGVGTLLGRLCHGSFIDRKITTGTQMFSILSFGCSLTMFLYGFANGIVGLGILSTIAGMCIGTRFVLAVVVMKEMVDEAFFKEAVGWCYCFQGIGTALGSPLTGIKCINN